MEMFEWNFEILLFEKYVNCFRVEIVESRLENLNCKQGVSARKQVWAGIR